MLWGGRAWKCKKKLTHFLGQQANGKKKTLHRIKILLVELLNFSAILKAKRVFLEMSEQNCSPLKN